MIAYEIQLHAVCNIATYQRHIQDRVSIDDDVDMSKKYGNYITVQQIELIRVTSDIYRYICCLDKPVRTDLSVSSQPIINVEIAVRAFLHHDTYWP